MNKKLIIVVINAAVCLYLLIVGFYLASQTSNSISASSRILGAGIALTLGSLIFWLYHYSLKSKEAAKGLKYIKIFFGLLLLLQGLILVINLGVYVGPSGLRVEAGKRLFAVLLGIGLTLFAAVWLLKDISSKRRYVVIATIVIFVALTQIRIDSYVYEGSCDIAYAEERLSLIGGDSLEDARQRKAGACHGVTYTLYIL